jgi:hypothetical protein
MATRNSHPAEHRDFRERACSIRVSLSLVDFGAPHLRRCLRSTPKAEREAMAKSKSKREEVVLQIPDLGLTDSQIASLKKSFKSELISSMGGKAAARARIVIIRIRIVRATAEH